MPTIQNSIFSGDALDSRPFSAEGSATGLTFTHNLVAGWSEGAYLVEGSSGSVTTNVFTNDGNGVITESAAVDISHNSFSGSVGAEVVPIAFASESIGSFVHDNTYDQARPISVFAVGPAGQTITGSDVSTTFHDEFHTGALTVQGGSGNDVYIANPGDNIVEQANGGTDEVRSTGTFALPANVENLTLLDGDSNTQTFDDMALGPITNGENGWTVNGPNAPRDQEIVDVNGNHEFRMSSNPSIADFAGPFSPQLSVAAGEPDTGAAFSGQSIKFDIQAVNATPDGSRLEIDFGNAAGTDRNNFMVIESFPGTGIRIAVSEPDTSGNFDGDGTDAAPNDWRQLVNGGVDPTTSHSIELRLDYVDGANNDVIGVYLDGKEIGTTTTFENFHDALGGDHVTNAQANLTDRVFFRLSGNGAPQGAGVDQGFLIDNPTTAVYSQQRERHRQRSRQRHHRQRRQRHSHRPRRQRHPARRRRHRHRRLPRGASQLRRDVGWHDRDRRRQPRRFAGRHRHGRPHQRAAVQRPQDHPGWRQQPLCEHPGRHQCGQRRRHGPRGQRNLYRERDAQGRRQSAGRVAGRHRARRHAQHAGEFR